MPGYLETDCQLSAIQICVVLLQCMNNTLNAYTGIDSKSGYNQHKITFWFQFYVENKSILYRTNTVSKQFCQIYKQCRLHFVKEDNLKTKLGLSIGKTA